MGVRRRDVVVGVGGLLLGLALSLLLSERRPPRDRNTELAAPPPAPSARLKQSPSPTPSPVAPPSVPLREISESPPDAPTDSEPPPDGGPVRIRLRDAENGAPCGGVIVEGTSRRTAGVDAEEAVAVATDADGMVVFPGGKGWRLVLRDPERQLFDDRHVYADGTAISEAWCGRMTVIRGTVRLEDPAAAAGVPVVVEARIPANPPRAGEEPPQGSPAWLRMHLPRDGVRRKVHVENGTFSISVPAWLEEVRLLVSAKGHIPQDRPLPNVRAGESHPYQDFELVKGASVPVLIVDGEGRPVPTARLHSVLSRTMPKEAFSHAAESARGGSWGTREHPGEGTVHIRRLNPSRVRPDGTSTAVFKAAAVEGETASILVLAEGFHPFVRTLDGEEGDEPLRLELKAAEPALPYYRFRGPEGILPEGTVMQLLRNVDGFSYAVPGKSAGPEGRFPGTGLVRGEAYGMSLVTTLETKDRRVLEGRVTFGDEEVIDVSGFEVREEGPLPRESRR